MEGDESGSVLVVSREEYGTLKKSNLVGDIDYFHLPIIFALSIAICTAYAERKPQRKKLIYSGKGLEKVLVQL